MQIEETQKIRKTELRKDLVEDRGPISNNRRIPISTKLKAIDFANLTNNTKATAKFGVTESTIRYWKKQKDELMQSNHPKSQIRLHSGATIKFAEIEPELFRIVEINRKLVNAITS